MFQHHRAGPDHSDRVGDALPRDVRRGAVHRLEHRREIAFRIDVARRRDADGAGAGGAEIGEDVAEQIGADHDVEPIGMQHEVRGEDVDVILVPLHFRIVLRHRLHALVPIGHRDRDAVGLGRRGQMLLRARLREIEREFQDAVDADARHHGLLGDELTVGVREHAPADGGILTFGVFAHHPEIDIAGLAVGERRRHAGHQSHRAQIDILVELAPEFDERAPQGDVIRDFRRPADRTEIDRIVLADFRLPVLRHHLAVLFVIVPGSEVEMIEMNRHAVLFRSRLEHAQPLRDHFLADAVTGNDRNPILLLGAAHRGFPCCPAGS